jgi:hypothetical protein
MWGAFRHGRRWKPGSISVPTDPGGKVITICLSDIWASFCVPG